jgi:hypothetical protein
MRTSGDAAAGTTTPTPTPTMDSSEPGTQPIGSVSVAPPGTVGQVAVADTCPELFHGTAANLQPGDVVEPRPWWPGAVAWAYATTAVEHAAFFGPHVYIVEALSPLDPPAEMDRHDDEPVMLEVVSSAGFQVVERVR